MEEIYQTFAEYPPRKTKNISHSQLDFLEELYRETCRQIRYTYS